MIGKELKYMIKNPAYPILLLLPFALSLFMSEGTKNYLLMNAQAGNELLSTKEVILYRGELLTAQIQFATSELSFMLLMSSILLAINIFEERRLHVFDRIADKNKFLLLKIALHFVFTVIMVGLTLSLFYLVYQISYSFLSIVLFCSISIISLPFGTLVGLLAPNRAVLSNTMLTIIMLLGYFGGALSLISVLSNTRWMNMLMYLSPLTIVNKLIFQQMLELNSSTYLVLWMGILLSISLICFVAIKRRLQNGSIL